jgi:hypothetical protein
MIRELKWINLNQRIEYLKNKKHFNFKTQSILFWP